MQNFKFKSVCGVVALVCLVSTNIAWSEGGSKRGFFDSFVNFFTPSGSVQGEGPIFDELKGVETQIDKIEVQYSRERRPGNKTRYRKQLDSLRNVRDSLITVIEKMPSGVNVAQSSAALSSAAQSSSSVLLNTAGSSASKPISSSAVPTSSAANVVCARDTVFVHDTLVVRDTVVIHDTLYVVLASKPEATPKASPSKSKKKADKASEK
ncbi:MULTISPECIES: hypothetical protein [unclassified Fibrobacter]|uniref:hypothetical protein n=1 Tax=unclassified Fibrobacter TaxID=2634177 RepID=UPI00090F6CE8|nr:MULTISPECIES: hypothetical protein [unclassified Fibrobacter]SHM02273.1 hypothetical protein SAMN05720467_0331 [Fibrobacter sp. UWB7]SMG19685.1 hypothetical protein SAMN05720489_1206 [Fibrobacter sp. UWB13]